MSLIIGLTGSIATGKSTISKMFREFNIPVIDADEIAHLVVEPGQQAYNQIVKYFGDNILSEDATINRPKLGEIIFSDSTKLDQLNSIVHPAVRKEMLKQRDYFIQENIKCMVLDIPLLFESKLTQLVEKIIVVNVDKEVQLERLIKRNSYPREEAIKRIQSQIPVSEKAMLADAVINNNGTKTNSYIQLENILTKWNVLK